MRRISASDRSSLIRLASTLQAGTPERRAILSGLQTASKTSSSFQKDLDESKPIMISGLKGMKSKPATKKFKNMAAYEKWLDTEEAGDWTVQSVYNA